MSAHTKPWKKRLSEILQRKDTQTTKQLLQEIEESFTSAYEFWHQEYCIAMQAFELETLISYNDFCIAVLGLRLVLQSTNDWATVKKFLNEEETDIPDSNFGYKKHLMTFDLAGKWMIDLPGIFITLLLTVRKYFMIMSGTFVAYAIQGIDGLYMRCPHQLFYQNLKCIWEPAADPRITKSQVR